MAKIPGVSASKPRATGARGVDKPKVSSKPSMNMGANSLLTAKAGNVPSTSQGMLQGADGLKKGGMVKKKKGKK